MISTLKPSLYLLAIAILLGFVACRFAISHERNVPRFSAEQQQEHFDSFQRDLLECHAEIGDALQKFIENPQQEKQLGKEVIEKVGRMPQLY